MLATFQYHNDIFAISLQIKTIENLLSIKPNFSQFQEKVLYDVAYLNSCIDTVKNNLIEKGELPEKVELIKLLQLTVIKYIHLLENLPLCEEIAAIKKHQEECLEKLATLLMAPRKTENKDIVTQDEMQQLLG